MQTLPSHGRELDGPIWAWVGSPAFTQVLEAFGGRVPGPGEDLSEILAELDAFSDRWDFRGGQERNLVVAKELAPDVEQTVLKAAAALGLVGRSSPAHREYDHVLILGGLVRACLARPLHAAKLLAGGTITARSVTALGGFRPLRGDEHELAARFGLAGLDDEFDAMDAGVRQAFGVSEPSSDDGERSDEVGASWAVRGYRTDAAELRVVAAPSSEPGVRRANTPDTYAWFAKELAQLGGGERILVVTTDIYVPFQHADALRMLALPYGVEVDAVGIRPGDVDERLAQRFVPHNYLQEMRSTIRAFRQLHAATLPGSG